MPQIRMLDQQTIDKIAAGEVVNRPSSVVKELVENAIDARATAITVEIKNGGIDLIRITDNGTGIEKKQVPMAFLRHSTSKIRDVADLLTISSLGFRGEALSSIAAVSQVELITKPQTALTGIRYRIEGGKEIGLEEIGAPGGTTILVKNLFYNTPARKKFLRTPQTEAGYISALMDHLALSHPDVSFKFLNNGQMKLHTSGNGKLKDTVYSVFGREITANLLEIHAEFPEFSVSGFLGKPVICRGNRNYENYFINGRYIKSTLIAKAIEDAYKGFLMQHKYPFTVLQFSIEGRRIDVNVHPGKMEMRFSEPEGIYEHLTSGIRQVLSEQELILNAHLGKAEKKQTPSPEKKETVPEPFEEKRMEQIREAIRKDSPYERKYGREEKLRTVSPSTDGIHGTETSPSALTEKESSADDSDRTESLKKTDTAEASACSAVGNTSADSDFRDSSSRYSGGSGETRAVREPVTGYMQQQDSFSEDSSKEGTFTNTMHKGFSSDEVPEQTSPADDTEKQDSSSESPESPQLQTDRHGQLEFTRFLQKEARPYYHIIGQVFETYWLIEFEQKLFIIDQHAAHEKVLYERTMASYKNRSFSSQMISPPLIVNLSAQEENLLKEYLPTFEKLGFEIEEFGENSYALRALPADLYGLNGKEVFLSVIDGLRDIKEKQAPDIIAEKIASMSCKAAVKGNQKLSYPEIKALLDELLTLENPYFCPHGRPVIISISRYEMDRKFKRIL